MNNLFERLTEQTKSMKSALKQLEIIGEAGAGMVRVIANGCYEVQRIEIDDEIYQAGKEVLIDLVRAASNNANEKVKQAIQEKMGQFATGVGLPANINLPFNFW
jgi:nucleoid-associated protein EbfC